MYDYQGNTNAVLDEANAIKASYRYTTYGALVSADETLDNPFKYLGQHGIQSDSSALYYVRARYYSPELNRWTQADVKRGGVGNPLSLNRYVLNEGDGVNYIDISGYKRGKSEYKPVEGTVTTSNVGVNPELKIHQINGDVLKVYSEAGAIVGCVAKKDGNFIMGKCGVSASDGVGAVVPIKIGKLDFQIGVRAEPWKIYNIIPQANSYGSVEEFEKKQTQIVERAVKTAKKSFKSLGRCGRDYQDGIPNFIFHLGCD